NRCLVDRLAAAQPPSSSSSRRSGTDGGAPRAEQSPRARGRRGSPTLLSGVAWPVTLLARAGEPGRSPFCTRPCDSFCLRVSRSDRTVRAHSHTHALGVSLYLLDGNRRAGRSRAQYTSSICRHILRPCVAQRLLPRRCPALTGLAGGGRS